MITVICALAGLLCSNQVYHFKAGDLVPSFITDVARCSDVGEWRFGVDVFAWKDFSGSAHVRPEHQQHTDGYLIGIDGSKGCHFNGKTLDVRWPGQNKPSLSYGNPWFNV